MQRLLGVAYSALHRQFSGDEYSVGRKRAPAKGLLTGKGRAASGAVARPSQTGIVGNEGAIFTLFTLRECIFLVEKTAGRSDYPGRFHSVT